MSRNPSPRDPAAALQPLALPLFDGLSVEPGAEQGRLAWRSGHAALRDCLLNILLTRPGERLMRPNFGAGLRDFIHLPNNGPTRALLADAALRALVRDGPRILVDEVHALADARSPSRVNLSVRYRLRATGRSERFDLALDLGTTLAAPR